MLWYCFNYPHTARDSVSPVSGILFKVCTMLQIDLSFLSRQLGLDEMAHQCVHCGNFWGSKSLLKIHLRFHNNEKPYSCSYCDKSFHTSAYLKLHIRTHTGEKPYFCFECDKRFNKSGVLKRHMNVHNKINHFPCQRCKKSFSQVGNLKKHQLIHTGELPFQCPQCQRCFRRFQSLKQHKCDNKIQRNNGSARKEIVSENKKIPETIVIAKSNLIECKECRKTYSDSIKLQRHKWRHTGERTKTYSCSQCPSSFLYSKNLKQHMKIHTGEKNRKTIPMFILCCLFR